MSARRSRKIVALGPVHSIPGPDPSVVFLLKELLDKAKAGGIKGLAVAYVDSANAVCTDWTAGHADGNDMVAAISQLWFIVMKRKYEDD